MSKTDLQGAYLPDASLASADLAGANLQDANLQNANLPDTNLVGVSLVGAALQGAKLQGANLQNAKLQRASLWDTKLRGANMLGAHLEGASVSSKELTQQQLVEACVDDRTGLWGTDLKRPVVRQPCCDMFPGCKEHAASGAQGLAIAPTMTLLPVVGIAGRALYYSNATPVRDVTFQLSNLLQGLEAAVQTQSDSAGQYKFTGLPRAFSSSGLKSLATSTPASAHSMRSMSSNRSAQPAP